MTDRISEKDELARLVDSLCEGDLTEAEWLRIRELVCANPSFRAEYLDATQLIASLELECADNTAREAVADLHHKKTAPRKPNASSDQSPVLLPDAVPPQLAFGADIPSTDPVSDPARTPDPKRGSLPYAFLNKLSPDAAQRGRWLEVAPLMFVGCVVFALGIFVGAHYLHLRTHTETRTVKSQSPAGDHVATLQSTAGATWWGTELPTTSGSRLVPGTLRLHSGVVEIEFDDGANVVLQGPATLEIQSRDGGFLHCGKLLARVPPSAVGVTIKTPTALVVDLGTEFGIVAGTSGTTDSNETEKWRR